MSSVCQTPYISLFSKEKRKMIFEKKIKFYSQSCFDYSTHLSFTSRDIMLSAIVRFLVARFVRRERGKKEKRRGFPIYFSFAGSRETREKSYEIDVRFIRTVESHLSISMAVLVVRSKFNPARKSRILIGGYNFAADRRCFSHPSSSVSPFEN